MTWTTAAARHGHDRKVSIAIDRLVQRSAGRAK